MSSGETLQKMKFLVKSRLNPVFSKKNLQLPDDLCIFIKEIFHSMGYFLCGVKRFHIMHNLTLKAIALRYDPLSYLLNCVYTIWLNKLACFRKVLDLCFRTFNAHLAPSFQHSLNPATYFRWHLYAKYIRGRT